MSTLWIVENIVKQYGRNYELIIGNDQESVVITDLTVTFDIDKTISSEPNPATFTVTNLNQSTRNLITSKKYNRLMFNFGYADDLKTLYVGYIDEVENSKEATDIVSILTCADGAIDYRESRVAVTLNKGATDQEIIKQSLKTMVNTTAGIEQYTVERQLPRGKTIVGNTRDVVAQVAKNQNADWSIQDGQFMLLPKQNALANDEGFVISEDTGMIGSPQKTSDGLEVRCYLNNVMRVGQLCRVESMLPEYTGDFKIIKLQMKGGNRQNECMNVLSLQNGQFFSKNS